MSDPLKAPFPWFGSKYLVADEIWQAFGAITNYVEPFAGSFSVLLNRPHPTRGNETVNDLDCHLVNVWRSIATAPEELAELCIGPVAEANTEAQHNALVRGIPAMRELMADPLAYDLTCAAWWIKGANEWIGTGWCTGEGPWSWTPETGWANIRQLPHLGNSGTGINRQLPYLGDSGRGINRKLPHLGNSGTGINRQLPYLGDSGRGIHAQRVAWVTGWLCALRDRLCGVRITCGDWERICQPSGTTRHGMTGIFLDPPYSGTEYVYYSTPVSESVREWCRANAAEPLLRIVLAGRDTEHDDLGWHRIEWKGKAGYSKTEDRNNEVLWLSPNCIITDPAQATFDF